VNSKVVSGGSIVEVDGIKLGIGVGIKIWVGIVVGGREVGKTRVGVPVEVGDTRLGITVDV